MYTILVYIDKHTGVGTVVSHNRWKILKRLERVTKLKVKGLITTRIGRKIIQLSVKINKLKHKE